MTPDQTAAAIERLEKAEKEASPGPWIWGHHGRMDIPFTTANIEWIHEARNSVPILLSELKRLQEEVEQLTKLEISRASCCSDNEEEVMRLRESEVRKNVKIYNLEADIKGYLAVIDEMTSELAEQARPHGMGSEREARLMAELDEWKWEYANVCNFADQFEDERDKARQELAATNSKLKKTHARISAACGLPDAAEACRVILGILREVEHE